MGPEPATVNLIVIAVSLSPEYVPDTSAGVETSGMDPLELNAPPLITNSRVPVSKEFGTFESPGIADVSSPAVSQPSTPSHRSESVIQFSDALYRVRKS